MSNLTLNGAMIDTIDMFIKARKEFPEVNWEYRHNADLVSHLMPIKNPNSDTWHTGRMMYRYNALTADASKDIYCFNANESFISEAACAKAIDEQPF